MKTILLIILGILTVYLFQAMLAAFFNAGNCTRLPYNVKDLFRLIWLPYVLKNKKKIKS